MGQGCAHGGSPNPAYASTTKAGTWPADPKLLPREVPQSPGLGSTERRCSHMDEAGRSAHSLDLSMRAVGQPEHVGATHITAVGAAKTPSRDERWHWLPTRRRHRGARRGGRAAARLLAAVAVAAHTDGAWSAPVRRSLQEDERQEWQGCAPSLPPHRLVVAAAISNSRAARAACIRSRGRSTTSSSRCALPSPPLPPHSPTHPDSKDIGVANRRCSA